MAKEAEAHAGEDKEKREEIDARNSLDGMVYNIEKMLKDNGDKMQGPEKGEVETVLEESKKVLEGTPTSAELKAQNEKLSGGKPQAGGGAVQGQRWRKLLVHRPRAAGLRKSASLFAEASRYGNRRQEYVDVDERQ